MRGKGAAARRLLDEWPTVVLLVTCYAAYGVITLYAATLGPWLALTFLTPVLVLHSSLQHEIIHGHPTRFQALNDALVALPLGLFVPYLRFKDSHLDHHFDPNLTDPYDDPESNYLDPAHWHTYPAWRRGLANFNNTLFGRMSIGPLLGLACFLKRDLDQMTKGNRRVQFAYVCHAIGLIVVAVWMQAASALPLWAYMLAGYLALSILRIRTFLEHQADARVAGRTVVIDDRGPLAFLFLNNNLHAVHHAHPELVWHQLPKKLDDNRSGYFRRNGGYWFDSYWSVFRLYLFARKDPVAHPLMPGAHSSDRQAQQEGLIRNSETRGKLASNALSASRNVVSSERFTR